MPRKRKVGKMGRNYTLDTPLLRTYLRTGVNLFDDPLIAEIETDEALHRALWTQFREALMERTLRLWPGTRPYGWWVFEKKTERPPMWDQPRILAEMGELTPEEKRFLEDRRRNNL